VVSGFILIFSMAVVYLENSLNKLDQLLHKKNAFTDILSEIETKTGVRRLYSTLGFGVFLVLYLMVGYGASFLSYFVGFLYPAYESIKAIESPNNKDDKRWLTYWVVFSIFNLAEFFADILFFWIPFYWLFKVIFLIYCMIPTSWNGSIMIYTTILRPLALKYQDRIEDAVEEVSSIVQDVVQDVINEAQNAAPDVTPDVDRDVDPDVDLDVVHDLDPLKSD